MNEFDLIRRYFALTDAQADQQAGVALGIGDDCAVLTTPVGRQLVISADTLVAGRHFPLDTDAYSIGWKAVAVNLSDIAAMGAKPHSLLLALSLPTVDEAFLADFSRGLFDLCAQYDVRLIGGDTTKSPTLSISITALGWVESGQAVQRSGAVVGDLIVVTGTVGDAAYALQHPSSPLQSRLDRPTPRVAFGQAVRGFASAMLDVSDGLAQDLGHILQASAVGAWIDVDQLPLSPLVAATPLQSRLNWALKGGDDYELCLTIAPDRLAQLQQIAEQTQTTVTVIGQIDALSGLRLRHDGHPWLMDLTGFMHFDS
jgi:thiamine-monophosphate kinase